MGSTFWPYLVHNNKKIHHHVVKFNIKGLIFTIVELEKLLGCCDYIFCFQEQLSIMISQLVVLTSHMYILLGKHWPNARVVNQTMNH